VIAICGVIHYWWLVKKDVTQPMIYAGVLGVLLWELIECARWFRGPRNPRARDT
jgi:sulfoxide reductase heme-binding subunit YedZ